jgi:hypothetical protein
VLVWQWRRIGGILAAIQSRIHASLKLLYALVLGKTAL